MTSFSSSGRSARSSKLAFSEQSGNCSGPEVLVLYLKRPRARNWELRWCVRGHFRYSDLKEAAPGGYGICFSMRQSLSFACL